MKDSYLSNVSANPLADLISDDVYALLQERGFINEKTVRDYYIRKKFQDLRKKSLNPAEAIDVLREEYPYLQFDTIRKIVYKSYE